MSAAPSQFPPPVDSAAEFVGPPTDAEDERIEVGVAIVGGGQAGMACAIRLLQLLEDDPELTERLGEVPVAVIEKGRVAGAHQLSGGVMNPSAIRELLPDDDSWPHFGEVKRETVYFMLNRKRAVPLKPTPPPFKNHGNYVVSVAELNRWLGEKAEEMGAYVLAETVGAKLLVEDGKVVGVRTGDKGRDKSGGEKGNFEPGSDVIAKATVLAEGNWGHLTGAALKALDLAPKDPQVWALGVKEVWEVAQPFEKIVHTLGWPLRAGGEVEGVRRLLDLRHEPRGRDAARLDRVRDRPGLHRRALQRPRRPAGVQDRIRWCARSSPTASAWPGARRRSPRAATGRCRRCTRPAWSSPATPAGWSTCPSSRASTTRSSPAGWPRRRSTRSSRTARATSRPTRRRSTSSQMGKELYESRNMKQPFAKGLILGGAITNAMVVTKGRFPGGHWATHRDAEAPLKLGTGREKRYPKPDGKYTFDKLSGVFLTGNATRDDAPSHIRIQQRVPREVGEGWAWMCPAGVYEVPEDAPEEGMIDLIVNPSNCVQCGAITAKGGRLTPPEGGDGPVYQIM